jgi:hypothetical protein
MAGLVGDVASLVTGPNEGMTCLRGVGESELVCGVSEELSVSRSEKWNNRIHLDACKLCSSLLFGSFPYRKAHLRVTLFILLIAHTVKLSRKNNASFMRCSVATDLLCYH